MMAKIKGKFAPLTDELGYDPRFKELNDLEKLMYVLIIHTCHMTRHQAPTDPNYYRMQYGIRHRYAEVKQAISKCQATYKQLRSNCGKLSLINSVTYESQIRLEEETEEETDTEEKNKLENFEKFWKSYPKRKSKGQAQRAWLKLKPTEQLCGAIFTALERAKTSADWVKEQGKYIPYPATWLNAHGWEDEYEQDPKTKKARDEWSQPFPVQQTSTYSNTQEATSA